MKKEKIKECILVGIISGVVAAVTLVILFFTYVEIIKIYDEYKSNNAINKDIHVRGTLCRFPHRTNDSITSTDSAE